MPDDVLQIRCPGVCVYALRDDAGVHLIDGGFLLGRSVIRRALRRQGWDLPVRSILVTHGHLDHVWNIAPLVREYGCRVVAPPLDVPHYEARHRYRGVSRACGILEAAGRTLFGYTPFRADTMVSDGDTVGVWGGLQAVHLPGHTAGHTGYFSPSRRLLFCGDLFASFAGFPHRPPGFLNTCPALIDDSIAKALDHPLDGVAPNHCDRASFETHLSRLRSLRKRAR